MSEKKAIRIVKKGESTRPLAKPKVNSAREATRHVVGTVANWITEFQQKRRNETANALRIFSSNGQEDSGSNVDVLQPIHSLPDSDSATAASLESTSSESHYVFDLRSLVLVPYLSRRIDAMIVGDSKTKDPSSKTCQMTTAKRG